MNLFNYINLCYNFIKITTNIYYNYTAYTGLFLTSSISGIYGILHMYKNGLYTDMNIQINNIIELSGHPLKVFFYSSLIGYSITPILAPYIIKSLYKLYMFNSVKLATELYNYRKTIINISNEKFIPDNCVICLENINDTDESLSCGHVVHRHCFISSNKLTCPICLQDVYMTINELTEYINRNKLKYIK